MAYTTIDDPSAYFHVNLHSGNETNNTDITFNANAGDFQPDWIWFKGRTSSAIDHALFDSSRGTTKILNSNNENAENAQGSTLKAFNSNGFRVGDDAGDYGVNKNGRTYVTWSWKCNGGTTSSFTESSNNPGGTIQTNTTAGFSIITTTGTGNTGTIAHGLGAVPEIIISKQRSNAENWAIYHGSNTSAPETEILTLNTTDATADNANAYNDTAPTSSVFTVHTKNEVNTDARTYVHYVFTPIQGYSKFGSYIANNSTDGPFVYLGFKPAWILIHNTSSASDYPIADIKREVGNPFAQEMLFANGNDAETSYSNGVDFLSNGFKVRSTGSNGVFNANNTSHRFIYMAFAEHPFVSSKGVPTTAR